ncbi:MAG: hypothetical protein AB9882_05775 [Ignavibacteriaceae bacterium]
MKFLTLLLLLHLPLFSQLPGGAKQIGMANSGLALADDVFSLWLNPAGLAQLPSREFGVFWSPQPFGFSELSSFRFAYTEPLPWFTASVGFSNYGFELYKENQITVALSRNFSNLFFVGISADFSFLTIKNYGSDFAAKLNLSGLYYITNDFRGAFEIRNLTRSTRANEPGQIPVLYSFGLSYDFNNEFKLSAALEKETGFETSVMGGFSYEPVKYLSLRGGVSTVPEKFTAGVGIIYSYFQFDYAIFTHPDFGVTHQFGLLFSFEETYSRAQRIKTHLDKTK